MYGSGQLYMCPYVQVHAFGNACKLSSDHMHLQGSRSSSAKDRTPCVRLLCTMIMLEGDNRSNRGMA